MARLAGIDLPKNKKAYIGLTYIFGIGEKSSTDILAKANVNPNKKISELSEEELAKIRSIMTNEYKVEGISKDSFYND
ncbi:MAG: 30S ribosomal protein S13 [Ignavibacteria bacterium]|nr:MAG: 30S ribosomal protein S13 [Ignavibacteria bacterium]